MFNFKIVYEFNESDNSKFDYILKILFIISIILIPFDNLPYFKNILGELSVNGTIYVVIPIIILVLIDTLHTRKIYIPKSKINYILVAFFVWVFISGLFNLKGILGNQFKGRSGTEKILLQIIVLFFAAAMYYCFIYIIGKNKINLKNIRCYIAISLIPVGILAFFELMNLMSIINFSELIKKVSYLIHTYNRGMVYPKGIRSVTGEASYFGTYSAFALPYIVSYIFTEKGRKKKTIWAAINLYFLLLIVMTKSRTAYGIIFTELFCFFIFIITTKTDRMIKKVCVGSLASIVILFTILNNTIIPIYGGDQNSVGKISIVSLYNSLTDDKNMSNVARTGMQRAAFNMAKHNPIFGVGLGQYGFFAGKYVDEVALTSFEVRRWIGPNFDKLYWPPAFSIYHRIMAEEGFLGFLLWAAMIIYGLYALLRRIYTANDDIIGIAITISYIGVFICAYNLDTFKTPQIWLSFAIVQMYTLDKKISL